MMYTNVTMPSYMWVAEPDIVSPIRTPMSTFSLLFGYPPTDRPLTKPRIIKRSKLTMTACFVECPNGLVQSRVVAGGFQGTSQRVHTIPTCPTSESCSISLYHQFSTFSPKVIHAYFSSPPLLLYSLGYRPYRLLRNRTTRSSSLRELSTSTHYFILCITRILQR